MSFIHDLFAKFKYGVVSIFQVAWNFLPAGVEPNTQEWIIHLPGLIKFFDKSHGFAETEYKEQPLILTERVLL